MQKLMTHLAAKHILIYCRGFRYFTFVVVDIDIQHGFTP